MKKKGWIITIIFIFGLLGYGWINTFILGEGINVIAMSFMTIVGGVVTAFGIKEIKSQ